LGWSDILRIRNSEPIMVASLGRRITGLGASRDPGFGVLSRRAGQEHARSGYGRGSRRISLGNHSRPSKAWNPNGRASCSASRSICEQELAGRDSGGCFSWGCSLPASLGVLDRTSHSFDRYGMPWRHIWDRLCVNPMGLDEITSRGRLPYPSRPNGGTRHHAVAIGPIKRYRSRSNLDGRRGKPQMGRPRSRTVLGHDARTRSTSASAEHTALAQSFGQPGGRL
jgi:hypothetical protein